MVKYSVEVTFKEAQEEASRLGSWRDVSMWHMAMGSKSKEKGIQCRDITGLRKCDDKVVYQCIGVKL